MTTNYNNMLWVVAATVVSTLALTAAVYFTGNVFVILTASIAAVSFVNETMEHAVRSIPQYTIKMIDDEPGVLAYQPHDFSNSSPNPYRKSLIV